MKCRGLLFHSSPHPHPATEPGSSDCCSNAYPGGTGGGHAGRMLLCLLHFAFCFFICLESSVLSIPWPNGPVEWQAGDRCLLQVPCICRGHLHLKSRINVLVRGLRKDGKKCLLSADSVLGSVVSLFSKRSHLNEKFYREVMPFSPLRTRKRRH